MEEDRAKGKTKDEILVFLLLVFFVAGCIPGEKLEETKKEIPIKEEGEKVKIKNISLITVYDNYDFKENLKTNWGFSCVIKTAEKIVLFDTGGDAQTLLGNMNKMGIEPGEIDLVVLSHIHGDHVGGLSGFLEKNHQVKVYGPKSFPSSFREEVKASGADFVDVDGAIKIEEGVYSTGELGTGIKEQSLILDTEKGLIVVTGCSHPGIVRIVEEAKKQHGKNIYLVIGGWHLGGASDNELQEIINSFRKLGVKQVAPCHCSGDRTRELFKEEYGDNFITNGVGKIIEI